MVPHFRLQLARKRRRSLPPHQHAARLIFRTTRNTRFSRQRLFPRELPFLLPTGLAFLVANHFHIAKHMTIIRKKYKKLCPHQHKLLLSTQQSTQGGNLSSSQ
jgi:hypothetical protein